MKIYGIISANPEGSSIVIKAALSISWTDDRLKWNPSDYDDISRIPMNQNSEESSPCVWTPDMEIILNVGTEPELNSPKVIAHHNGTVHIFRIGIIRVVTLYEMSNYPFDEQTVKLMLIPRTYSKQQIDIDLLGDGI